MSRFVLLAANGTRARFFIGDGAAAELVEIEEMVNPRGALHEREFVSDRPGRHRDQMGVGRSAINETTRRRQSLDHFAAEIAEALARRAEAGELDQLTIVAAPALLGRLRARLPGPLRGAVIEELAKDLTSETAAAIQARLECLSA